MPTATPFKALGAGNGFPGCLSSVNVRPYVAPSSSNNYTATGFERFRTLGGYSNSNSGAPTKAQLDLSLKNAMQIYWNIYSSPTAVGTAELPGLGGGDSLPVSFSSGGKVYHQNGKTLQPKDRVSGSFTFKGDQDQYNESRHIFQTSIATGVTARFNFQLVRMIDNTDPSSPVFLGYGISRHFFGPNVSAGGGFDANYIDAQVSLGSFFNRNQQYFVPQSENSEGINFEFNDTTFDGMPFLSLSESRHFPSNDSTPSVNLGTLSSSISWTPNTSLVSLTATASLTSSSTFFSYSQ